MPARAVRPLGAMSRTVETVVSPREFSAIVPGSKFPLTGAGVRDNGSLWFRGLFGALGSSLAACGRTGREVSHMKINVDESYCTYTRQRPRCLSLLACSSLR